MPHPETATFLNLFDDGEQQYVLVGTTERVLRYDVPDHKAAMLLAQLAQGISWRTQRAIAQRNLRNDHPEPPVLQAGEPGDDLPR